MTGDGRVVATGPRRRHPGALDRPEPEPGLAQGRHGDRSSSPTTASCRRRRSAMTDPIALHDAAGGGDARRRRRRPARPTGRPQMDKAPARRCTTRRPATGGGKPGAEPGHASTSSSTPRKSPSPRRPSGSARPTKGAKKAGAAGVHRVRAVQADAGDVLRRHRQARTAVVVEAVEKLFGCCVPTEKSAGQKKPTPPLVVLHWGAIPASRPSSPRSAPSTPCSRSDGTPIRAICTRVAGGDAGRARQAEPDLGQRQVRRRCTG